MKLPVFLAATLTGAAWTCGAEPNAAATAVNTFGITLHQRLAKPDANLCLSPYSIQLALAMTYAGAEGATKDEMARVLHYGKGDAVHASFSALQKALAQVSINTQRQAEQAREFGGAKEPFVLRTANQLFGEQSYAFKAPFLKSVRDFYAAPLEKVDFRKKSDAQTRHINQWVENKTEKRIKDLIPPGVLDEQTRLVLVNAVYMKAPWLEQFSKRATKPASFHVKGGKPEQVPTMLQQADFGYAKRDGYTALTLPYIGGEVHFLILLPDDVAGLPALETSSSISRSSSWSHPASAWARNSRPWA
jgi:serpin B